jgi:uncharacterized membrane protein
MGKLSAVGRIFYGIAIAGLGFLTIYYQDFPYMLIPPKHLWIPGFVKLAYISGALFILAGVGIVFEIRTRLISLLLGTVLLLIFCFYFIPYQFMVSPNYMHLVDWENAEKELALAGGAFVMAGCFSEKNGNSLNRFSRKLIPFGSFLFSITMISFGILHFLYAKDVSDYVPSWVSNRLFWAYLAGTGLISSGLAIILKIKTGLAASLLGAMIFIWFSILHVPRVIVSPVAYMGSEVTSALIALAYSGIAFVIAGAAKKQQAKIIAASGTGH